MLMKLSMNQKVVKEDVNEDVKDKVDEEMKISMNEDLDEDEIMKVKELNSSESPSVSK